MRGFARQLLAALIALPAIAAPALADETEIKSANQDMDKVEKDLPNLKQGDSKQYNSLNGILSAAAGKLKTSPSAGKPEHDGALRRCKLLQLQVQATYDGKPVPKVLPPEADPVKPPPAPPAPSAATAGQVDWTGEPDSSKAGGEVTRWKQWKDSYAALWKKVSDADPVALAQSEQRERERVQVALGKSRESILRRIMRINVDPFATEKEKQVLALFDAKIAEGKKRIAEAPPPAPPTPPPAPTPPMTPAAPTPAASRPEPGVKPLEGSDLRYFEQHQKMYQSFVDELEEAAPGNNVANTEFNFRQKKGRLEDSLFRIRNRTHPDVLAAKAKIDGWDALVDARVAGWKTGSDKLILERVDKEREAVLAASGADLARDERVVRPKAKEWRKLLEGLVVKDSAEAKATHQRVEEFEKVLDQKIAEYKQGVAAAAASADAEKQERTRLIEEARAPFEQFDTSYEGVAAGDAGAYLTKITPEQQKAWLDRFKAAKAAHAAGLAKLEKAATLPMGKDPYLVVERSSRGLAGYTEWYRKIPASIDEAVAAHEKALAPDYYVENVKPTEKWTDDELTFDAGFKRGIDPIELATRMVAVVLVIEKDWYGRDGKPQEAEITRYKAWIDGLKAARTAALTRVRLPADIGDAELRKFAEEGFAHVKRTVRRFAVTTRIEKKDTGERYQGVWVPLVWEQFRVMTVEKDEQGAWRLHYVYIRKNQKGWDAWKFGVWTVHMRDGAQGPLILDENIDK